VLVIIQPVTKELQLASFMAAQALHGLEVIVASIAKPTIPPQRYDFQAGAIAQPNQPPQQQPSMSAIAAVAAAALTQQFKQHATAFHCCHNSWGSNCMAGGPSQQ
jgi:predicted NAD/FAD-dependent oxidoreductase